MIFALWNGGHGNYSAPDPEDVEWFDSIREAREAFESRYRHGYTWKQTFNFVYKPAQTVLTPCVGENAFMDLYGSDPNEGGEMFRRIEFGPRGGIVAN